MKIRSYRTWIQLVTAGAQNGYVEGFLQGRIYTGDLKKLCVPGLNCYSCPGAYGSCPIGSLQAELTETGFRFPFYVLGMLVLFGTIFGRAVCGFLCPFGLIQDLLYKIPFMKKLKSLPGERFLRGIKYLLLGLFVILLPLVVVDIIGQGDPWFCKVVCPAGTLSGIFLMIKNPFMREALGLLYAWKMFILIGIICLSILIYRPFCRYLCPLGGIYGWFNPIALYRYKVEEYACTRCRVCEKTCPFEIPVYDKPNDKDCIRCGRCVDACPETCIKTNNLKARSEVNYDRSKQNI